MTTTKVSTDRSAAVRYSLLLLVLGLGGAPGVWAVAPADGSGLGASRVAMRRFMKEIDSPNPLDRARIQQRLKVQQARRAVRLKGGAAPAYGEGVELLGQSGTDRVLVILVEFGGTNTFTWTPGVSTWDPLGRCDNSEYDGANTANSAASWSFANKHGILAPKDFTYTGPLHNQIPRPLNTSDPSTTMVWVPDFAPSYYSNIIFGDGIVFDFARQDGSRVHEDFTGMSVRDYFEDLSDGAYTIAGTVLGWVQVPNSVWQYGGDGLPGARSCSVRPAHQGAIPGAGNAQSLVVDALESAKAAYPGLDWASFDQNGDGYIDRLWIIHAGLGEEDNPGLLNRTSYGEGGMWSHSWSLATPHQVAPGVAAWTYIMMPENAGIAVLAHEFGHNLGAIDLYTYGDGQTSAGFWTLMADSWVGYPLGFLPEAMDPMHLDQWGWLRPLLVTDPAQVYSVKLGQASRFPSTPGLVRGVKIELPEGGLPLPVQPRGRWYWWGGKEDFAEGTMVLRRAVHIPAVGATLEFQAAYDTEWDMDCFYIEASADQGGSWQTLAALTGSSPGFPNYQAQSLSLAAYANRDILLRFRYATDYYILGEGPFVDDIVVRSGAQVLLADDAEVELEPGLWAFAAPWSRNNGQAPGGFAHHYYLQWRNTRASGGYDQALGRSEYRFGPVNAGLLVWYQDNRYWDNSIAENLTDPPSFGPKGRLLVVDAHPEPDLDPYWIARGVSNELAVVFSRGSMRDAPFSRWPTTSYRLDPPYAFEAADFAGRPAVPQFSDSAGYYPGIQDVGPSLWRTWQWDASVVLPSTRLYGVRGPAYPAGTPLQTIVATRVFVGAEESIAYRTNLFAAGLSQGGGDGNPGSGEGDYGWNVRVVHQTDTWAEVVIWNRRYEGLDADGDGMPNWQEAIAGTDPRDARSCLRITRTDHAGPERSRVLEWPSATNRVYRVLRGQTVSGTATAVGPGLPGTPPTNSFLDLNPGAGAEVYYRLQVE